MWRIYALVCPFVFLAGFVDAIGGGGGLISLPIYMIAGLPVHQAVATNKLSSACGTAVTTVRFFREKLINMKLAIPSVIAAMIGSSVGARISLLLNESILKTVLLIVLPFAAIIVMSRKMFNDNGSDEVAANGKTMAIVIAAALIIGMYDGMYGPGTGTFLIIAFTLFAKMSIKTANAQAKVINLVTNITSLMVFLMHGQVMIGLGLVAAVCNILGNYLGAGLALKKGSTITRPIIIGVLILLFLKIIFG